jgi:hypothetical protein
MLLVSVGALGIAMLGGAKLAYDVLGPGETQIGLSAAVIALAIAYVLGWLTAMVAIRVYGNLILPIMIHGMIWLCLAGVCYLYIEILERLYLQEYSFMKFWKYVFVMVSGLAVLVGLHLIIGRKRESAGRPAIDGAVRPATGKRRRRSAPGCRD